METNEARQLIVDVLGQVAPEIDVAQIDPDEELQVECDLDSMDFLNLVEGVSSAVHHDIPERDYPQLATLNSFSSYVAALDSTRPG
jgi:acyl carrier protein